MARYCGLTICAAKEFGLLGAEFSTFSMSPFMPISAVRPNAVSTTFCRIGSASSACALVAFGAFCSK
jgi:hypothetical protein